MLLPYREVNVVTHRNADLDSYGSALGVADLLRSWGLSPTVVCPEGASARVRNVAARVGHALACAASAAERPTVLVDVGGAAQLGGVPLGRPLVVVDHHSHPDERLTAAADLAIRKLYPSCSEIVVELLMEGGVRPAADTALFLALGILEDTGKLMRASPRTLGLTSYLLGLIGARLGDVAALAQEDEPSGPERIAHVKAAMRMRAFRVGGRLLCISYVGSYESSAARALLGLGCDIAMVLKSGSDVTRLVARSRGVPIGGLVKYVAARLGWAAGGHDMASVAAVGQRRSKGELRDLVGTIARLVGEYYGEAARSMGEQA